MPGGARLVAVIVVCVITAAALIGWACHIEMLKSVLPGLTTMKVNTALGLAAGALSVASIDHSGPRAHTVCIAAAVLAGGLGLLSLLEYVAGVQLGLDQLLILDPGTAARSFPGRMSPATAVSLLAAGCSLLLLRRGGPARPVMFAHLLAVVPAAIGLLSLAGYTYGVSRLYHLGPYVAVALHTGLCLVLLALCILLIRPDEGWGRGLVDRPIARSMFLQIVPISLVVPFATGMLVIWGIRAKVYEAEFAPALCAVATAAALLALAFRSANILAVAEGNVRLARDAADRSAEQLEASRSRHQALVEELPQLVWTCLPDGSCDYLSPQWVAYTGSPEAGQLGFGWLDATHPDDRKRTHAHWLGAVAGQHPYDIEFRLRAANGAYRWFKSRGIRIRDGGQGSYWFGTCTDIQDIVAAREVMARSRQELQVEVELRTAELMAMEAELRQVQKMEAVGRLTGGIAHDFNNLLTGISGSLELLQRRIAQGRLEDAIRYIDTAMGAARRAASLTQRLLAFSRRQALDPVPTDLDRLTHGMEELIRRTVGPAIKVEVLPAEGLWPTLVDPGLLENALLNLCINGRDAMPNGGRLTIATANAWLEARDAAECDLPDGAYVCLRVSDTGAGMTAETMRRAFDPFFTTKPLGEGTGLGLSMVYGFVRQSGGQIRIWSQLGQGTIMEIHLPRHLGEIDRLVARPAITAGARATAGQTILLVEDEPSVRGLIHELLDDLGYTVVVAGDGAAGLAALRTMPRLDLLVTDVGLPGGMTGREVADAARALRPGLKVMFITGYAENAALDNKPLDPDFALLTKPFLIEDFTRKLNLCLIPAGCV